MRYTIFDRMEKDLYIGTAGWTYDDWEGVLYPRGASASRRFDELVYLGKYMNLVEINTTFYRIPSLRMTRSWARRGASLENFRFIVKLYQGFTHTRGRQSDQSAKSDQSYQSDKSEQSDKSYRSDQSDQSDPFTPSRAHLDKREVTAFCRSLEPLASSNALAMILVQFPWSFKFGDDSFDWLKRIAHHFSAFPLAVEMRHSSWLRPRYFEFLEDHAITFVNIDQPLFHNSIAPTEYVFTDNAYFRFHGRNKEQWFVKDAGPNERYNYCYSDEELGDWIPRIRSAEERASKVYVVCNNHFKAQAACNALQIKAALTGKKVDVPDELLQSYPQQLRPIAKPTPPTMRQTDMF